MCRFNNFGFCKVGQKICHFYHSTEICDIYLEKGICYRVHCRKRHPRTCRYETKWNCYRGSECKFFHKNSTEQEPKENGKKSASLVLSHGNTSSEETKSISCRGCKIEQSIFTCEECGKEFGISCLIESHDIINMYMKNSIRYRCDMVHQNPCI